MRFRMGPAGVGVGGGRDGGDGAGLFLCGAVAWGDGGFGGIERTAGGGDSGGGVGRCGGVAGDAAAGGFFGGGAGDLADCGGTEPGGEAGGQRDVLAGGGWRGGVWGLFCGAEVCWEGGGDLADGDGRMGSLVVCSLLVAGDVCWVKGWWRRRSG